MDKELVTLIASGAALLASFITLFVNIKYQRASEFRAIHRKALEPYLVGLSNSTYEILAITSKVIDSESNESQAKYVERAKEASLELDKIRRETRYILWGLDEPLRMLAKEPLYFVHLKGNKESAKGALAAATELREGIDKVVVSSYRKGHPPSNKEILYLNELASNVRSFIEVKHG